jgi:hypothetical protein
MLKRTILFFSAPGRAGRIPAWVLGLLLLPAFVSAGTLVHEDFNYPPGPLSGAGGGTGWSAAWQVDSSPGARDMTVVEGTLSYGNLQTSGNRARSAQPVEGRTGFSGSDPFRCDAVRRTVTALTFSDPSPAVLWLSYLIQIDATHFATQWFGLKTTASDNLWFGLNANSPFYGMEMPRTDSRTPFSTNRTDLLVLRVERRPDGKTDKHLWINPAPDSLGGPDPALETATLTHSGAGPVDSIPGILLHCANAGDLDEIRVGETFADVTPVAATEPPASSLFSDPDAPRWVNGQPAGELDSVEAEGLRIRTAPGASTLAPWSRLSLATRFRYQPGFPDQLSGLLKGRPDAEAPRTPTAP